MIVNGVLAVIITVAVGGQVIIIAGAILSVAIGTGTPIIKGTMTGPLAGIELLESAPPLVTEILTSAVAGRIC